MTLADRIVVMNQGRLEQIGKPLDLYYAPANLFVAGFIGSPAMNFFKGRVAGRSAGGVEVELGEGHKAIVRCKPDGKAVDGAPVTLGVRPEALNPDGHGDSTISGTVHTVERLGGETYLYLSTREGTDVTVHAPGDMVVASGDELTIGFSADKCHLFHDSGEAFERYPV